MATGVFGADTSKPLVVKAGKAVVTCGGQTLIALDVSVQFGREVQKIPTISRQSILSIGEAQGTVSASTILAKDADAMGALHLGDDGCDPFSMTISFRDGACGMNGKTITCHNCVASSVSLQAQGGRGFIAQGVQIVFTALTM